MARLTRITLFPTGQGREGEQKTLVNVVPEPNTRTGMIDFISDGLMRKPVFSVSPQVINYIEYETVPDGE